MNRKLNNMKKYIALSENAWKDLDSNQLITIPVERGASNFLINKQGLEFINLSSCSYLGLECHPLIIQGAIEGVKRAGSINMAISRLRIRYNLLDETEQMLSSHFNCEAITSVSCGIASYGILPIIASGYFTNNESPIMIFDRFAHLSMHRVKPICGEETQILNCEHNDLNFVEDICKKHKQVAYVTDGVFSVGGVAPVKELLTLQEKYGLLLYFDDSHSLSLMGDLGQGYVRTLMPEMNDRTFIVASLVKSFAASGAIVMMNSDMQKKALDRFSGPFSWSQCVDNAALGAIQGSLKIHKSDELSHLQQKLQDNLKLFDSLIPTRHLGSSLPIRIVDLGKEEDAVKYAKQIYDLGFFTSSVFFPVIPKGKAGLRIMMRASLLKDDIYRFAQVLNEVVK